jgi:hypothetical protein
VTISACEFYLLQHIGPRVGEVLILVRGISVSERYRAAFGRSRKHSFMGAKSLAVGLHAAIALL